MLSVALHFTEERKVEIDRANVSTALGPNRIYATIRLKEEGETRGIDLYFHSVEQIETLVEALQKLGNDMAAAEPQEVPILEADTDDLPLSIEEAAPQWPEGHGDEAGECRGCHRAIEPGGEYCDECEQIVEKIAF